MYELVTGPLVWVAFAGFVVGGAWRLVSIARAARREKSVLPTYDLRFGLRSLLHWVVPFASRNTRLNPVFTAVSMTFHLCLLATPLFVMGHAVLWQRSWGMSWWSLPPLVADVMTGWVVCAGLFLLLRRLVAPEVRNVTSWRDLGLLLLVIAPFATGLAAHRQWLDGDLLIVLHAVTGALWLIAIPFTRLAHMIWFALTRAYMGSEFGSVRHARDW